MAEPKGMMNLFPTQVFKFELGKQSIKNALKVFHELYDDSALRFTKAEKPDLAIKDSMVWNEVLNHPSYLPLQQEVLESVASSCPQGKAIGQWKIVTGWANKQVKGATSFPFHSHTDAVMSCVVYLQGKDMTITFRDNPKESLMSNQGDFDEFGIICRRNWWKDVEIPVSPGDIILFPSYLVHKGNTNEYDEERVCVAYNLWPERLFPPDSPPWVMQFAI